jgi:pyruvate formate lyase activating enzyme
MGRIQSIQSFSTFDGPGTRCVVFLQGCPMGCLFCHNPDSWAANGGSEISVEQLLRHLERFRSFLQTPGLTISGGEPLAQPEFTLDLILNSKAEGWHVALDTSGWGPADRFIKLAGTADLVMFSIKHPLTPEKITKCDYQPILANWRALASIPVPVIVRYVLIPGWTDRPEALTALGALAKEQPNLERVEILPFNGLAADKWAELGWSNPLFERITSKVTEEQIRQAEQFVRNHI